MVTVQPGTAGHLLARRPDQIDQQQLAAALSAIRVASARGLAELGGILGLLRGGGDPTSAHELQPQVGLERLDDLVTRARADGLTVTVAGADPASELPRALSSAASP